MPGPEAEDYRLDPLVVVEGAAEDAVFRRLGLAGQVGDVRVGRGHPGSSFSSRLGAVRPAHLSRRNCLLTPSRSNSSGSKPPPHSSSSSCCSWLGSRIASRYSSYPHGPPTSSGGHAPLPSTQSEYFRTISGGRTFSTRPSCFQLSPKS